MSSTSVPTAQQPAAVTPSRWTMTRGGPGDSPLKRAVIHAILFLAALIAVVPVLRVFSVSLRPENRLLNRSLDVIPEGATLESYGHVLFETDFPQWLSNSLIITVGTSLVGLIFAATSAYGFSRFKFPGRAAGLTALLATQLIPATMLLVPILILAIQLDLIGTYRGLVIACAVTSVPFSIWILKGYYDTVPIELEEAARIDGCSQLEAFWRVLLPLPRRRWPSSSSSDSSPPGTSSCWPGPHRLVDRAVHLAARHPALPGPVPDAVGRPGGRVDPRLDPDRGPLPVQQQVADQRRDPGRRQGMIHGRCRQVPALSR